MAWPHRSFEGSIGIVIGRGGAKKFFFFVFQLSCIEFLTHNKALCCVCKVKFAVMKMDRMCCVTMMNTMCLCTQFFVDKKKIRTEK